MSHPGPRGISGPCSHPECYNSINDKCPGCGRSWLLVTALDLDNIRNEAIERAVKIVEKFYMCRYWENPQHDVIEEIVQLIEKEIR